MTGAEFICVIAMGAGLARACYLGGKIGEQNKTTPEILELREEVSRLRLLSKLQVCGQCSGEQRVYNRLGEWYERCPTCKGAGEVCRG